MTYRLSARSQLNLRDVHPDLRAVIERAIKITPIDFGVIEGIRTMERQKQLFAAGATKTLNSRHLTGHAVDLAAFVGGSIRWDWPLYDAIAVAVKQAAKDLNVPIIWGGDWTTFKDGPHFELDRNFYHAPSSST